MLYFYNTIEDHKTLLQKYGIYDSQEKESLTY
jgi:hypothetical protein